MHPTIEMGLLSSSILEILLDHMGSKDHSPGGTSQKLHGKNNIFACDRVQTLILVEEIDILFPDDRRCIAAIQQIAETARGPIILTSNSDNHGLPDNFDRLHVSFSLPSPKELLCHLYWEELLGDRYEEYKVDELNALGKGKRSRNKLQGDGFAGPEDVSSDGEDDNYEADLTDNSSNSTGIVSTRRPHKRKVHAISTEPLPLIEGEGRTFRVLGFNQNQRSAFLQILMRFGVGDFDWNDFTSCMKQKSYEEIKEYGALFLSHIAEDINDSPTFSELVS